MINPKSFPKNSLEDLAGAAFRQLNFREIDPAWNFVICKGSPAISGQVHTRSKNRNRPKTADRRQPDSKRTVLNGVRAYIRGAKHPDPASSEEREKEWKQINKLRQDIFHSLEDRGKIRAKSHDVLVAAAHHLHDAICCLSHTHDLESQTYRMRRGAKQLLLKGTVEPGIQDTLEDCCPVLTLKETGWDHHPEHGFVPRFNIIHDGKRGDIGGYWFWLRKPLDLATEADLDPAKFE